MTSALLSLTVEHGRAACIPGQDRIHITKSARKRHIALLLETAYPMFMNMATLAVGLCAASFTIG